MRIGTNPLANKKVSSNAYHRILVPVFVPNLEGYFEQAFEVTRMCIESLIQTRHEKSILCVVNNGSCEEITTYLQQLFENGLIDQLVHHKSNQGKIDAVVPIARTCAEPLVTITDGDVLFKHGWMQAVEKVFSAFPRAGMVSPVPHGTVYSNFTINTLFDGLLLNELKFDSVCNQEDMMRFAESIGKQDTMYRKGIRLKYQLTVQSNSAIAVVGCGHFVSTLKREVFEYAPYEMSRLAYATEADRNYIDLPNEKAGFWRLATTNNLAYHMGNQPPLWIKELFEEIKSYQPFPAESFTFKSKRGWVPFAIKQWTIKVVLKRPFRSLLFKYLGLKEDVGTY